MTKEKTTDIKEKTKKEAKKSDELVLGIDDSGRGPVIGPMVMAGVLLAEEIKSELKELGVKDSKMLTPKRREILSKEIKKKAIAYKIIIIEPKEIDQRNHVGLNLNKIEAIKSAEIINTLAKKERKEKIKVVIDCPSPNQISWKNYVVRHIDSLENLSVACEHKADKNHISVGAASILAKTTRDAEIEKIKKKIGADFGSGYTSDPVSMKFLKEYAEKHKHDGIFRQTWSTWQDNKKAKEQRKIYEY